MRTGDSINIYFEVNHKPPEISTNSKLTEQPVVNLAGVIVCTAVMAGEAGAARLIDQPAAESTGDEVGGQALAAAGEVAGGGPEAGSGQGRVLAPVYVGVFPLADGIIAGGLAEQVILRHVKVILQGAGLCDAEGAQHHGRQKTSQFGHLPGVVGADGIAGGVAAGGGGVTTDGIALSIDLRGFAPLHIPQGQGLALVLDGLGDEAGINRSPIPLRNRRLL